MEKMKSWVIYLITLAVIYGGINFLLWGAQELYWSKDTSEIKQLESFLGSEKTKISSLEAELQNESDTLDRKQSELDRLEKNGMVTAYNSGVSDYNLLLQKYNSNLDLYSSKLTTYNNKVERINELSKNSGSRWYVIPVPTGPKH